MTEVLEKPSRAPGQISDVLVWIGATCVVGVAYLSLYMLYPVGIVAFGCAVVVGIWELVSCYRARLCCKCFVGFNKVHVIDGQTCFFKQTCDGRDRPNSHF